MKMFIALVAGLFAAGTGLSAAEAPAPADFVFQATTPKQATAWQRAARDRLFAMMMGGSRPKRLPLEVEVLSTEPTLGEMVVKEIRLQSLPDRKVHAWLAVPRPGSKPRGAVLALHGHGGTGEEIVRGKSLYAYGRSLVDRGYVVIAPDIGSHRLQHTNWSLMGERVWDSLRCIDYLETLPEVDKKRIAVAGLSLGGETTMYVAALDSRIQAACSSGWLTTVANMKKGHCPCWNFPGLENSFDFSDIFACVAPRPLVLEIGEKERAPGGFPADIARGAFAQIRRAYEVFGAETNADLVIHPGGHVYHGDRFNEVLHRTIGGPSGGVSWLTDSARTLLEGCRIKAEDGSVFYTPDGQGHYRALWTRDFAYMVENAGDLMPPADVGSCLEHLIGGIREDGATPDRVRPDGVPVYTAGPENAPMGQPNIDNAQFLVIACARYLNAVEKARRDAQFERWAPRLHRAMDWIPRAASGLVWNDPDRPHSPYGFTDTVAKTGELFFESILYWKACRELASLCRRQGDHATAAEYRRRATLIKKSISSLWDESRGVFLAATRDCRQVDVWGNAYALWIGFPLGKKREGVLSYLKNERGQWLWHGQVRHLPKGEYWQRLFANVEKERYQNGAYWAAASGWMISALATEDNSLGQRVWQDLLADMRAGGICECVNEGYRQLPDYVVSAVNPLAAVRRLNY